MDVENLLRTCLSHQQLPLDVLLSLPLPDDPFGRFLINQQLEQTRHPRAIDLLLARLADDDPDVAASAAHALSVMREARAHKPLHDLLATSRTRTYEQQIDIGVVADAIVQTGTDPTATLLNLLHTYGDDSVIGTHVISRLPPDDNPEITAGLLDALGSASDRVEEAATRRLAETGRRAPQVLASCIFDHTAPRWLDELPNHLEEVLRTAGPNVVPSLIAIATAHSSSSDSALRVILRALYAIQDARAVPVYEELRTHRDRVVRAYAVFGLAAAGDQRVQDALLQEVGQGWGEHALGQACAGLGSAILPRLLHLLHTPTVSEVQREEVISVLGMLRDPDAVPILIEALTRGTPSMRRTAVRAFGEVGDAQAVAPLIQCLTDPQEQLRQDAVVALYSLGRHHVATMPIAHALVEVMVDRHETPHVRQQAALLLPSLGGEELLPAFRQAFEEQHPQLSVIIGAGLASLGAHGIAALIEYARSGREPLQTSAFNRLYFVHDPVAEQVVIDGLKATLPTRRKMAAMAIHRWRLEQARELLMVALEDADEAVQREVIAALGTVGDERSLVRLLTLRRERGEPQSERTLRAVNRALIAIYYRVSGSPSYTDQGS